MTPYDDKFDEMVENAHQLKTDAWCLYDNEDLDDALEAVRKARELFKLAHKGATSDDLKNDVRKQIFDCDALHLLVVESKKVL